MLGAQMKDGFATAGLWRQEDYKNLEEKMSAEMEEGFKNEENARNLVQHVLAVMKDEIKNLKHGQWQSRLQRGQHKSGSRILCFRQAAATHFSLE